MFPGDIWHLVLGYLEHAQNVISKLTSEGIVRAADIKTVFAANSNGLMRYTSLTQLDVAFYMAPNLDQLPASLRILKLQRYTGSLDGLARLQQLRKLVLNPMYSYEYDCGVLGRLPHLQHIKIECLTRNITGPFPVLTTMELQGSSKQPLDLSFLRRCPQLLRLDLLKCPVKNCPALPKTLQELSVDEADNLPVEEAPALTRLCITDMNRPMRKLACSAVLESLSIYNFHSPASSSYGQVLSYCTALKSVYVKLQTVDCLYGSCHTLRKLTLSDCTGSIAGIGMLSGLLELALSGYNGPLEPLSDLQKLSKLEILSHDGRNLEPLRHLPLTSLDLTSYAGNDLAALYGCPLTELNIRGGSEPRHVQEFQKRKPDCKIYNRFRE